MADIEWVLLRSFPDATQARLFGEFLDNQGIQVSVEGAFSSGMLPGAVGARVMVPADRLEDAQKAAEAFAGEWEEMPTPVP